MMAKKVLIINQTFYPDCAATSQQLTDLAIDLVKKGYSVTVISDSRSYVDRDIILPKYELYEGIRIFRIKSTAFGKKTKFHRAADYFTFTFSLLFKLFSMPKFDIVIGLTSPPWISFLGVLFCMFKRSEFMHWAMDINPDEAVALGWVKHGSFIHKFLEWTTGFTYKKSDCIIALDRFMVERIRKRSVDSKKIVVLPPWSHDDITYIPHTKNRFRKQYDLNGNFVVMYSGNFSICHPLDTVLDAALLLKDDKNIVFVFIGDGIRSRDIVKFKENLNLSNIICLPYQDRKNIKYSLSAANLHVVVMGEPFVGIVHPCKIYGILSVGAPFVLIGPETSHVGDIVREAKIGYRIPHGDALSLTKIIQKVRNLNDYEVNTIRSKSQQLARKEFSRKILSRKLIKICDSNGSKDNVF